MIDLHDGSQPRQCKMANFSIAGGRLYGFIETSSIPERVTVYIRDRRITKRECRVVWRGSRDIGVQFLTPPKIMKRQEIAAKGPAGLVT
jgi:hypothetical protein